MKILVLGSGNAFSKKNFNQSFLLEENGRKMMLDYGRTVPEALAHAKIKVTDIDDVYVSHLHGDHVGGLEDLAFSRYDWGARPQNFKDGAGYLANIEGGVGKNHNYAPRLIANEKLLVELWDKTLRGGLESMEGFDATIGTFFEPIPIHSNKVFKWEGWDMQLVQQVHIMTGNVISNTYGVLMSQEGHKTVYFTTDSQYCSPRQIEIFYKKADIVFQDCELIGCDTIKKEMKFMSGVHANFGQLSGWESANSSKLSADIKKKMILSHYQDYVLDNVDCFGNPCNWYSYIVKEGFCDIARQGQVFEV